MVSVMKLVSDPSTMLTGASFFEYQTRYDKGASQQGFGMLGLGEDKVGEFTYYGTKCSIPWDSINMMNNVYQSCCFSLNISLAYRVLIP